MKLDKELYNRKEKEDAVTVDLVDGRTIIVPLVWYPRLWYGTDQERSNYQIISDGTLSPFIVKPAKTVVGSTSKGPVPVEMHKVFPGVVVFVHPEGRSNCGMIHTTDGVVLVDTTARPVDIQACLTSAGAVSEDICLILITHSHSDHTSGIPLFDCPVLAHKLTRQRISKRGTDRAKRQMPTEVFEDRADIDIGGAKLEIIHAGGHTPGSSVVWLPEARVLFVGDLIFEGRYPFLATADVPKLMEVLRWIPSFGARVIVPGHGLLCGNGQVTNQLEYIESTWVRTAEHIALGHSVEEALSDPDYPRCARLGFEQLHPWNIKVIYRQLKKQSGRN